MTKSSLNARRVKFFFLLLVFFRLAPALADTLDCQLRTVSETYIFKLARPLLRNAHEFVDLSRGKTYKDMIEFAVRERDRAISAFEQEATSGYYAPVVANKIQQSAWSLRIRDSFLRSLEEKVALHGHTIVPDPATASADQLRSWAELHDNLHELMLDIKQFGNLGEWLTATLLPRVTQFNVGPWEALNKDEIEKVLHQPRSPDFDWLQTRHRDNFELDVIFNNGESIAEVKFNKHVQRPGMSGHDRYEQNARRLSRFLNYLRKIGIKKNGHFFFLGVAPFADTVKMIESYGIHVHHIDFRY